MTDKPIIRRPLPYQSRLQPREAGDIDLLVIHCTELPDLETAREYGERIHYDQSRTGNSGHYYIDRDGAIEMWADPLRVAHHVRGHNPRSIGIELVNSGRWPDWYASGHQAMREDYTASQVSSLVWLLAHLQSGFPGLAWIAGHEDLDREQVIASDDPDRMVFRKQDPGPRFPWRQVLEHTTLKRLIPEDH